MDRKVLIIGGTGLLVAGAIATGVALSNLGVGSSDKLADDEAAQEIEDQNFKDFADEDRYSFCQGREEIKGPYTSSIFGNEKGNIEYVSEDINVFDKEKNKLFILGRKIKYKYSGDGQIQNDIGEGIVDISELGETIEYYNFFDAPVRVDYNSKMIYPAPERKKNDWVVIERKGRGTVMGFTQEDVDRTMGDAKTFCPPFSLKKAFVTPDYLSFEESCDNGSGTGFSFSGNFKFECGGIDNERGIEIAKEFKQLEESRKVFDSSGVTEDGEKNEFQDILKEEGQPDDRDIQQKLQQLRDEMKADTH